MKENELLGGSKPIIHLFVDSGYRKAGVAAFEATYLLWAKTAGFHTQDKLVGYLTGVVEYYVLWGYDVVLVFEKMVKRDNADDKYDNLDKVEDTVAKVTKATKAWTNKPYRVVPEMWKRQVPKDVCQIRALRELSVAEVSSLRDRGHDTWDAVGIGLVFLKRLGPGLVRRRPDGA